MTSLSRIYKSYTQSESVVTLKDEEIVFEEVNSPLQNLSDLVEDISDLSSESTNSDFSKEKAEIEAMYAEADRMVQMANAMVEDARMQAAKIIEEAEDEGRRRKDELLIQGNKELGMIQQEGYQAGFEMKENEVKAMLEKMSSTLEAALNELQISNKKYIDDVEENVRGLILNIVEKILHKQVNEDPLALSCLIFDELDEIKKSRFVNVVLSNQAKELIDLVEKEFKENEKYQGKYSVETRDLPVDTMLLEHDSGVLDASVASQIAKLRDFFEE